MDGPAALRTLLFSITLSALTASTGLAQSSVRYAVRYAVRDAVRDAVNWARMTGCANVVGREPLQADARLESAARALSRGASLHASVAGAGYLATQSSVVHLSGDVSLDQVAAGLVKGYCSTLTDPALRDLGVEAHGHDVWLVLAAPLRVPSMERDGPSIARQVLNLVNQARAAGRRCGAKSFAPAPPLGANAALGQAAAEHSRDMAEHIEFDHRGHDGSSPAARVTRAGYGPFSIVGENIAAGSTTAIEVVQGWLESPPHCENIMDPRFAEMGLAFAVNLHTDEAVYWTQDFAHRSL